MLGEKRMRRSGMKVEMGTGMREGMMRWEAGAGMGIWKKEEVPESRGAETVYRHDPTPYGYRDFDGDDEENQRGPSRYSGVPHSNQRNLATSPHATHQTFFLSVFERERCLNRFSGASLYFENTVQAEDR